MQAETLTGLGLLDELSPDLVKSELMETLTSFLTLKVVVASPDLVKSELMETFDIFSLLISIERPLPIWLNRN